MDTKKLRQKILDLAIRGKLVPQNPNDEPASVLLERIRAEKQQLIKEGKIKAPKGSKACDTSHYEKIEGPFEIPESWEWVKISDIADVARGGSPRPIDAYLTNDTDGINWIKIGDAEKGGKYINSTQQKIKPDGLKKSRLVHKGDFLLTNSMSFGRPYILNVDGCIHDGWLVISPIGNGITKDYFYHLLSSGFAYEQFSEQASGAVVSNLNKDKVADSLFPLPPINEQHKIVESIENWIRFVDDIENSSENLGQHIEHFKSKVLSLAISGKLVPQNPTDEPAIELLKRINPGFKPCDNSHYPFEIPDSWVFASGKDIFLPMKSTKPSGDEFFYIDIDSVDNKNNVIHSPKRVKTENAPSRASRFTKKGDVVFSMVRPYLRNIAAVRENGCIASTGFFVCSPNISIHTDYMFLMMLSSYVIDGLNQFMKGDNSPSINTDNILSWKYPVPPLNEQIRIVAEVQRLYQCLEQIGTHLTK